MAETFPSRSAIVHSFSMRAVFRSILVPSGRVTSSWPARDPIISRIDVPAGGRPLGFPDWPF